jgi:hypothetical protein
MAAAPSRTSFPKKISISYATLALECRKRCLQPVVQRPFPRWGGVLSLDREALSVLEPKGADRAALPMNG